MDASARLRVIAKHGVGLDTIDTAAAAERGIAVKAATGANADAVAEHTWALILACAKSHSSTIGCTTGIGTRPPTRALS